MNHELGESERIKPEEHELGDMIEVELAFAQLGERLAEMFERIVEQLTPVFDQIVSNITEIFNALCPAIEPFMPHRIAIEEYGITEADIRCADPATGIVYLHNRRWINVYTDEHGWQFRRHCKKGCCPTWI